MIGTLLDAVGIALIVLGLLLATIGLYGLLRMDEVLHQVHPAGLVSGPAAILVLLGSIATREPTIITSAALLVLFLLVTSPLSTHAIAQAAHRRADGHAAGSRQGPATAESRDEGDGARELL
jgi:multicomponent Na+:H+ antiporter subunit G